jgi:hypothetical protein
MPEGGDSMLFSPEHGGSMFLEDVGIHLEA